MGIESGRFREHAEQQLQAEEDNDRQFQERWVALEANHETPLVTILDLNVVVKTLIYQTSPPNWVAATLAFRNVIREFIGDHQLEAGVNFVLFVINLIHINHLTN